MSREITAEERRANIKHWKFQDRLMLEQGYRLAGRMGASGKPNVYENGNWRIRTARGNKWKLEWFTGVSFMTPYGEVKVWKTVCNRRFDTPMALALWFSMVWPYNEGLK